MAEYSRREVTTKHVEYYLPNPSNWAEVGKVFAAMRNELGEEGARWDDAVVIEANDEEIVFRTQGRRQVTP